MRKEESVGIGTIKAIENFQMGTQCNQLILLQNEDICTFFNTIKIKRN